MLGFLPLIFKKLKGTELDEWLDEPENIALFLNKRIFYVLKSNLDKKIIKFGVSTNEGSDGDGAYRRLLSYINYYGRTSKCERNNNDCKYGIKLYALYGNDYNKNTEKKNTMVQRKENYIKRELIRLRKAGAPVTAKPSDNDAFFLSEIFAVGWRRTGRV